MRTLWTEYFYYVMRKGIHIPAIKIECPAIAKAVVGIKDQNAVDPQVDKGAVENVVRDIVRVAGSNEFISIVPV